MCVKNVLCLSHHISSRAKGIVMHTCLSCHRKSKYNRRGCCCACYERYTHMVKRGDLTWPDLEATGHTRPAQYTRGAIRAYWATVHPPHPGPPPTAVRPQTRARRPWGHGEAVEQALVAIATLDRTGQED